MAHLTGRKLIAHLLRRAGFGGSPDEIDTYTAMGFEAAVDQLLNYERVPNDTVEARAAALDAELDPRLNRLPPYQLIWLYRMLNSTRPLEEKMTLFWHDHFATANYKVGIASAMHAQNKLFRSHALGSFRELLYGVSRDPAMLRWLDSNANRRAKPNENYARELMELFTIGIGNYTETDVQEAARAFTGWFFDRNLGFVFNRNQHDFGDKTFLGRRGAWDGDDIVNIILEQPVTAEHMAGKLFSFFVHDHPQPATASRLADTFRRSDYSVKELLGAILRSPEFASDEAYHGVVKSPVEVVIGAMKSLGIGQINQAALGALNRMGMALYNPPDVSGWDWGTDWIGSATLLERLNHLSTLTTYRGDSAQFGLNPTAMIERMGARTPAQIVDGLLDLLVGGDVASEARTSLLAYVTNGYEGRPEGFTQDAQRVDRTVRGVAHLIMATPVYEMA